MAKKEAGIPELVLEQKLGKMFFKGCAKLNPRENFQISHSQSARKFVHSKINTNKVYWLVNFR